MYFTIVFVLLGLLGFSTAVPLEQPYNPQDFFPPSRIVGGTEAPEKMAAHMVALLYGNWVAMMMCGGSIVSPSCVLTAAHCVEQLIGWNLQLLDSLRGSIGTNEWADERHSVRFSDYKIHPEWNRFLIKNDVGVLITKEKMTMSERVSAIPINHNFVGGGQEVSVTGYGRTSLGGPIPVTLQKLRVITLAPCECEEAIRWRNRNFPSVNSSVEICTRHKLGDGHGMCHGDSGSALFDEIGVIGVVSWGFPCAVGFPDMYARASAFKVWLHNIMDANE